MDSSLRRPSAFPARELQTREERELLRDSYSARHFEGIDRELERSDFSLVVPVRGGVHVGARTHARRHFVEHIGTGEVRQILVAVLADILDLGEKIGGIEMPNIAHRLNLEYGPGRPGAAPGPSRLGTRSSFPIFVSNRTRIMSPLLEGFDNN